MDDFFAVGELGKKEEAFGWFIKQLSPVIDCAFSARFCRDAAAANAASSAAHRTCVGESKLAM